jgi:hypothetical protein
LDLLDQLVQKQVQQDLKDQQENVDQLDHQELELVQQAQLDQLVLPVVQQVQLEPVYK